MPQLWCEDAREVMASGPYFSRMRIISLETSSKASFQLMRSYADLPRFCALRPPGPVEPGAPFGSKSTRFIGYMMRSSE